MNINKKIYGKVSKRTQDSAITKEEFEKEINQLLMYFLQGDFKHNGQKLFIIHISNALDKKEDIIPELCAEKYKTTETGHNKISIYNLILLTYWVLMPGNQCKERAIKNAEKIRLTLLEIPQDSLKISELKVHTINTIYRSLSANHKAQAKKLMETDEIINKITEQYSCGDETIIMTTKDVLQQYVVNLQILESTAGVTHDATNYTPTGDSETSKLDYADRVKLIPTEPYLAYLDHCDSESESDKRIPTLGLGKN